jgi:Universal stress protein family
MVKLSRPSHPFICPSDWQKLLLCTDGSPRSQGAIKATLALAQTCGQKVYVVNVLRVRAPGLLPASSLPDGDEWSDQTLLTF